MNYLLYFLSLILGVNINKNPIASIGFFIVVFLLSLKIKNKKDTILILTIYVFGILLFYIGKIDTNNGRFIGVVIDSKDNYFIIKSGLTNYYVSYKNSPFEVGDIILIQGKLSDYCFTTYESQFDFNKYLQKNFVYKKIEYESINGLFLTPIRVRNFMYTNLERYDENIKIILGKLLFNISIEKQYNQVIIDNSLFYLLSVSSLHIHLLNRINKKLFEIKLKEKTSMILIIFINTIVFIISNYKTSILKVLILSIINFYFKYINKKENINYIQRVSITGIIMILIKPYYAIGDGIIYSFGILYYLYICRDSLSTVKKKYRKLLMMFLVFLFLIPLNIYLNGYFSLTSIIFTQLFFPFIAVLYILGLIAVFIPIYPLVNSYGKFVYSCIKLIDKIGVNIWVGKVTIIFVLIYYLLLILFIYYLENKDKIGYKSAIVTMILLVEISALPIKNRKIIEVDYINVGQGDCTLIRYKNTNVLIDTGGIKNNDIACYSLIPYFKQNRIKKIDYVFITHNDYDHNGAFLSLQENFKVNDYNKNNYEEFYRVKDLEFQNLNTSYLNENNDDSLVLYIEIKNVKFLFMGDASKNVELKIMERYPTLTCDYLKVGHHGSDSSTCNEFIKQLKPKEAIISCGANNFYGHPNKSVIKCLNENGVKIKRTDIDGTITIKL